MITFKKGWWIENEPCTSWPTFTSIGFWLQTPHYHHNHHPYPLPTPAYSERTEKEKERRPSELQLCATHCAISRPTPSTDSEHTLLCICMYVCMYVCVYVCPHEFEWSSKRPTITTEIWVCGGGWYTSVRPFVCMFGEARLFTALWVLKNCTVYYRGLVSKCL